MYAETPPHRAQEMPSAQPSSNTRPPELEARLQLRRTLFWLWLVWFLDLAIFDHTTCAPQSAARASDVSERALVSKRDSAAPRGLDTPNAAIWTVLLALDSLQQSV